jgi:hypothetical protein
LRQFLQDSMPAQSDIERLRNASRLFNFLLALRVFAPVDDVGGVEG